METPTQGTIPGAPPEPPAPPPPPTDGAPLGRIVSDVAADVQRLFRQEIELAKAEMREEAAKAGKVAGMLGSAGFACYMVAVLVSLAAVFGLWSVMDIGWAALVVAGVWAVIGAVLFVVGRSRLRHLSPMPRRTVESLKEDAQWARNPTR